jgi:hypothetical protein
LKPREALRQLLVGGRLERVGEMAAAQRATLGRLVPLTFDRDPQIGWRAVEAMGIAARRIAETSPDTVRDQLRRLNWLLSEESGGICWRAPEAMAEIVRHTRGEFDDYIPIIVSLLLYMADEDLGHFRPGILWAIGRLGERAEPYVSDVVPAVTAALSYADPQVRGMAVWCLGRLGRTALLAERPALLDDDAPVDLYDDGVLNRTSIRRLARHALGT